MRGAKNQTKKAANTSCRNLVALELQLQLVKMKLSCETFFKTESLRFENKAFAREFPRKLKL